MAGTGVKNGSAAQGKDIEESEEIVGVATAVTVEIARVELAKRKCIEERAWTKENARRNPPSE